MTSQDSEVTLKQLQKELRILKKKLERTELDRDRLEETNQKKESLLRRAICDLQDNQSILENRNADLESAFNELQRTQDELVEARKMASLGGLVAGVAHEINTPVGTSITLASILIDETRLLQAAIAAKQLKQSTLNNYLEIAQESASLILSNLNRAAELVQSFKQVAVDQAIQEHRTFRLKQYLEEVVVSLSPRFKHTAHTVRIKGDESISIHSYPGAIAQVVTNLIANSLVHAYPNNQSGQLCLEVTQQGDRVIIQYDDDGCGISAEILGKIYEPFFSTARDKGGTGLGLNIVYNLVTQKLQGKIEVRSQINKGTQFEIALPLAIND
ncbi:sensor histidine kinase [Pseudanabaena sp. PCC 6802]|uniref:sensor histidine kinase n=1 Tax=Pseudanabaena sp. PCC 6802 TaxID=118173 RepID=UPI000347D451|nr:ATP-binding protein [Pseudanabaena sp. PCC 6802]